MHQDKLSYLRRITNLLQAHLIMTPKNRIVSFDPNEDAQLVFSKMSSQSENIDYAPIMKDRAIIGYVNRKDLACIKGKACGELAKEVSPKNKISPTLSLENVLMCLVDEPFLFVTKNKQLKGIITRADVNKRAFRTFLYIFLSELESLLVDFIRIRLPCEKHLNLLSEERAKDVLYTYWKAKAGNVEISMEQYLSFSDIINLILKSKDREVWQLLGCTSKKQVESLTSLVDLRNSVMHSTRLLLAGEDSILHIRQKYEQILKLLKDLRGYEDLNRDARRRGEL